MGARLSSTGCSDDLFEDVPHAGRARSTIRLADLMFARCERSTSRVIRRLEELDAIFLGRPHWAD